MQEQNRCKINLDGWTLPKEVVIQYVEEDRDGWDTRLVSKKEETRVLLGDLRYERLADKKLGFRHSYLEAFEDVIGVMTVEEYERERQEKKRQRLESKAADIARQHNVAPMSREFVEVLDDMRRGIENERYGMQEDGVCGGYGMTHQQWFDDYNYLGSKINEVEEIIEWLEENCPLLMARLREERLQEEKADESK